jgi:hypothetical protein
MNKRFTVAIQGYDDEELYFTDERPTVEAVEVHDSFPVQSVFFTVFKADNGYHGNEQKLMVPIERVIWISEDIEKELA